MCVYVVFPSRDRFDSSLSNRSLLWIWTVTLFSFVYLDTFWLAWLNCSSLVLQLFFIFFFMTSHTPLITATTPIPACLMTCLVGCVSLFFFFIFIFLWLRFLPLSLSLSLWISTRFLLCWTCQRLRFNAEGNARRKRKRQFTKLENSIDMMKTNGFFLK